MEKYSNKQESSQAREEVWSSLEAFARKGALMMIQKALEEEVEEFISRYEDDLDEAGKRKVVRNGFMPERELVTGLGPMKIKQPRVDDRKIRKKPDEPLFSSNILPRYLRRVPSIDNLIPVLYLKGISTGDFSTALSSILGDVVKGLSATNIVRLKQIWEEDYKKWSTRDLSEKEYVYFWVDGIHFNVRLDDERTCILVIMGADKNGKKELIAVDDGYRESEQSWKELLLDLKKRGLRIGPKLSTGDGALGYWKALDQVFPECRRQRCWVHKTANILDKMPKSIQSKAKSMIHEMYMAETKKDALKAYEHFLGTFRDKYPKATDCLEKDKDDLFTFYDFPAVHWIHIRTTNPIESTFATVRLRTKRTKGCGSRAATLTMVFKLTQECQKTWHRIKGYKMVPLVLEDCKFVDGILVQAA